MSWKISGKLRIENTKCGTWREISFDTAAKALKAKYPNPSKGKYTVGEEVAPSVHAGTGKSGDKMIVVYDDNKNPMWFPISKLPRVKDKK